MPKFSPEARAFFDREQKKSENKKETAVPDQSPEEKDQPEATVLDQEKIEVARIELLQSFESTTGEDPFSLVESNDPGKIDQAGKSFFSKFLEKHPKLKRAAMVSALLGGLMATTEPAEAGLREKVQAHLQRRENKENFELRHWEWIRDEIQKACPAGHWRKNRYNGNAPGWYFEIPAQAYQPYRNWTVDRVNGDRLPKGFGTPGKKTYNMLVPPENISTGEFLLLTTGHLDYVKKENDNQIRLVYCPDGWLTLGEIEDQQARLRDGPQEYRLYAHSSKAHTQKPWHTIPILKPTGDTYHEFWTNRLNRPIPAEMEMPQKP